MARSQKLGASGLVSKLVRALRLASNLVTKLVILSARHTTDRRVRIQAKGTFNQQKIARKKISTPSLPLNTPWGLISIVSVHFAPFVTK